MLLSLVGFGCCHILDGCAVCVDALWNNELQERERRRQHMNYMKQLDLRRRFDEREKKKHQVRVVVGGG